MAKQKKAPATTQQKEKTGNIYSSFSPRWYSIIIFIFSIVLYFNSVFNDYNLDDELVTQNHRLTSKGISAIPEIFQSPYFENKEGYKYEYRPIVLTSFALEHSIFGENAHVSHFINVLLYGLLCVLLFIVLRNLQQQYNILLPLIITMLFAAHPIHTEVVASIKNRDEILSLIFGLMSLHFAIFYAEQKRVFQLLLIPVFFVLGILSKSTIITFALLVPLTLILLTEINFKTVLLITVSFAMPAVFYSRLYSVPQQVAFIVALFAAVTVLYYLRNLTLLSEIQRVLTTKVRSLLGPSVSGEEKISSSLDFSFLNNKRNLLYTVSAVTIIMVVCAAGVYTGRIWLTVVPMLMFAIAFVLLRDELKAIFITPVSLITLMVLAKFNINSSLMEAGLVIFLGVQILSANKTIRNIGIVNYVFYALVSALILHSYFFFMLFIFAGFYNKKLFPVSIVIALASGYIFLKQMNFIFSGTKEFRLMFLTVPVLFFSVLLLWKNFRLLSKAVVISIPLFILLHAVFTPPAVNKEREAGLQKTLVKINTMKAVDPTPVQSLRPIAYMESPIDEDDALTIKLGTAMVVLGKYLKLIFFPYPMSYYYGYAYISPTSFLSFVPVFVFLIHLALFVVAIFYIRKIPLLSFAILFYLISISVFSNLIIRLPGMMGDRFLLIPSIGFCVFLAYFLAAVFKQDFTDTRMRFSALRMPFRVSLVVVIVLYSAITFSRNADWKDRITLFSHDIDAVENSAQAQNLLGLHLFIESGKVTDAARQKMMREKAAVHLKKAVEIYPEFLNASFDLARVYEALGRKDEAYAQYEKTMQLDSTFVAPCFAMAIIQQNKGNLEAAISLYEKFLTNYPEQMEVYANMSYAYFKLGKYDSSIAVNKRALVIKPHVFEPTVNIAKTFQYMNQPDSALAYFIEAQRINPSDASTQQAIANLQRR